MNRSGKYPCLIPQTSCEGSGVFECGQPTLTESEKKLLEKLQSLGTDERFHTELEKRMKLVRTMEQAERPSEEDWNTRITI